MLWTRPPARLVPEQGSIDIWRSSINLPASEIQKFHATLSEEEKQRAEKFTFADKYEEYVVSRGLLRFALALQLQRPAGSFEIDCSAAKKPFTREKLKDQNIAFNLSHSHGQVVLAISLDRNLGIDIEFVREQVEYEKLARRFFSQAEYDALLQYKGDQLQAFFATWTRKEAFVKALGEGIAFGLQEFDVNIDPHAAPCLLATRWNAEEAANWHMMTIETEPAYRATVVADGGAFKARYWQYQ